MKNTYQGSINEQELKDYNLVSAQLKEILTPKGWVVNSTQTEPYYNYDMKAKVQNDKYSIPYAIEIKEYADNGKNYSNSLLKETKYNLIINRAKQDGRRPLFINYSLDGNKFIIYDLGKLKLRNEWKRNHYQKVTQYDPNSPYKSIPTYFIPHTEAVYVGTITDNIRK